MRQLLLSDLWPTVAKLSKKASRVQAAIAYVSSAENLHLRSGDTLIADASENAIKTAQTSARVLQNYQKAGVAIFNCAGLHAKLLLIDDKLIVGSGNASGSSANRLTEAAILTDEATLVRQAQSFVFQLAKQSVQLDARALDKLVKIKVERRFFAGVGSTRKRIAAKGKTTWIAMVHGIRDSVWEKESRRLSAAERSIAKTMPAADPIPLRFLGKLPIRKHSENGDTLIVGWSKRRGSIPLNVQPPSALLHKQEGDRSTLLYYDPELSRPLLPVRWGEFKRLLKRAGVTAEVKSSSIRVLTADESAELQRIWPRT
jgi:hypothetical protein